ncbi:hypothetical protein Q5752_006313 [Cryptotrichosporon argae]
MLGTRQSPGNANAHASSSQTPIPRPSSPAARAPASASPPFSAPPAPRTMYPGFLAEPEAYTYESPVSPVSASASSSSSSYVPWRTAEPEPVSARGSSPLRSSLKPASPIKSATDTARPVKRRPEPLELGNGGGVDNGDGDDPPWTAMSSVSEAHSTLSSDMQDLSILGESVRRNLRARPVGSPLPSSGSASSTPGSSPRPTPDDDFVSAADVRALLHAPASTPTQTLVVDVRALDDFLASHLARAVHLSIPSLLLKRLRKQAHWAGGWRELAAFISTPAGRTAWDAVDLGTRVDVVLVAAADTDETAHILRGVLRGLLQAGTARILRGGWAAAVATLQADIVSGDADEMAVPRTALAIEFPQLSVPAPLRLNHHPSMPSLRPDGPARRTLPALSINPGASSRRPPKLSLNLDKPLRSATFDPPTDRPDVRPPLSATVQTFCHAQSKMPPSPKSFGLAGPAHDESARSPWTSGLTARPNAATIHLSPDSPTTIASVHDPLTARGVTPFDVSVILPSFLYLGPEIATLADAEALSRLGVKRILNVALECDDDQGLGLRARFDRYHRIPMKDTVEASGVGRGIRDACAVLDDARLHSAPTYVHCKAGRSRSVTVVLAYLIHANAWTLKTAYAYVAQRRRGISPNIGFVAELMTYEEAELGLKQSGGVHGDARDSDSDDEGDSDGAARGATERERDSRKPKQNPRHMRESLPPAWSSLESRPHKAPLIGSTDPETQGEDGEARHRAAEEREVRKNGQWVHHRRAPADRTTLQPGRRASKAGLESMRALSSTSPRPLTDDRKDAHTPGAEGRLGWV